MSGYESPLSSRYAGEKMRGIFSEDRKFRTWRRLWIILAEAERELGLPITEKQIEQMRAAADDINYETARRREREVRHDVMAHIYAYGEQCPDARPIIHLGATSCYVGDNTDILLMREALFAVRDGLAAAIRTLAAFADRYAGLPTLAYTHFQPAQPTTVGKRAALWISDFVSDLQDTEYLISTLRPLGCKGTTGTQASFLELFGGDAEKVKELDRLIAEKMGFEGSAEVTGQTYSRKTDSRVLGALSGIAQSAAKFSNDVRLAAGLREMEEPFEKAQVGSSAMAFKRNPMRCERIASLARYVICDAQNPAVTAASQWFERTLDDSANRRVSIPEAFLAVDGILRLVINVADGLTVYPAVIRRRLAAELPFMAAENIMMDAVKRGGDRQALHEKIRVLARRSADRMKNEGAECDLLERIAADPAFGVTPEELAELVKPENFTGCAETQTREYLDGVVAPLLEKYKNSGTEVPQITV